MRGSLARQFLRKLAQPPVGLVEVASDERDDAVPAQRTRCGAEHASELSSLTQRARGGEIAPRLEVRVAQPDDHGIRHGDRCAVRDEAERHAEREERVREARVAPVEYDLGPSDEYVAVV